MKNFYARRNPYGIRCSSDSIGWSAYRFDSAKARQAWIDEQNTDGRYEDVAEKCTKREAHKIAGIKPGNEERLDYDGSLQPF